MLHTWKLSTVATRTPLLAAGATAGLGVDLLLLLLLADAPSLSADPSAAAKATSSAASLSPTCNEDMFRVVTTNQIPVRL
jgi:membrane glycosyltransferase